jgi:high affinity sulfate transporter 1
VKGGSRSLLATVPGLNVLRTYERAWLSKDIIAGLVLTALLVPQGMAYAELAGLPPITGLYTSVLALFGYWLTGPSKVLVLGPDSALGPMIAATILPLMGADQDPAKAVALASMLALIVGGVMLLAGIAKLGFIADLLSMPTQIGYMNGLALTIIVGQLPKLFGFSVDADGFIQELKGFVDGLLSGDTVGAALAVGIGSLVVILVLQRAIPKVPAVLVAVVLSILAVQVFDLTAKGVSVVGTLPSGFPPFTIPRVSLSDIPLLIGGALGIVFVALADTISTASAFASRAGDRVHGNREMIGIGTSNIAAGLFQGFPVSTSGSRTAVAEQAGAKTQLAGLIGAAAIVVILVAVPGLFRNLPQPALAAVVITASLSLADVGAVARLWRQRKTEAWLSIAAFLAVTFFGVLAGIGVAVALSILAVFRRTWWPYQAILGDTPGLPGFHDLVAHPDGRTYPGLVIFRFDAPLIFANARTFREQVHELAERPGVRWILIASEPITDVDATASDMLEDLDEWLNARDISLVFAEMKDPVQAKIERYGLTRTIAPEHFFPTIRSAVSAYKALAAADTQMPSPPPAGAPVPAPREKGE